MTSRSLRWCALCLVPLLLVGAMTSGQQALERGKSDDSRNPDNKQVEEKAMVVQYLEIVTPSVQETCDVLAKTHGVVFSEPVPEFGNARTADLKGGGRIGVRAPMRETEAPVVRPYLLVDDIQGAVKVAEAAGATVALPPMEIPGQGMFSIYILGGIEHGLWQN